MKIPFLARREPFTLMQQATADIHHRLYGHAPIRTWSSRPDAAVDEVTPDYFQRQLEQVVEPANVTRNENLGIPDERRASLEKLMACVGGSEHALEHMLAGEIERHGFVATLTIALIRRAMAMEGASVFPVNAMARTRSTDLQFWRMLVGIDRKTHPIQILGAFAHYDAERAVGRPLYRADFGALAASVRRQMAPAA